MSTMNPERIEKSKKKRIKFFIAITIIELLLSILLAPYVDLFLSNLVSGSVMQIELHINFFEALEKLCSEKKIQAIFLLLQLAYIALILYCEMRLRPVIATVDTVSITDDIEIPIPAGNGQCGNQRFLTEDEKLEKFDLFTYTPGDENPHLPNNGGVVVQMKKSASKEHIMYLSEEIHSIIIGASGAGKSRRLLLPTMWLQIISGMSVAVSDVKGELYYYTSDYAEENGYKTLPFDLRNPQKSVHYNFMQPILDAFEEGDMAKGIDYTWDLVSVLIGEKKGEPLWYNGESATIATAILIVALDAPQNCRNLTNVYYFVSNMCATNEEGEMPINTYLAELPDDHPAKGSFAMAAIAAWRTRSSFFTSALGTLRLFTNPNVAEMTSYSEFKLSDISTEKTILYMIIPDEKKTLYPLVSILVTQLYQAQIDLANKSGLRLPIDTDFDLDELGNFPYIPVLGNIAAAGRSRGVRMNIILQDYQQLEKIYKDECENIKTNCQLKIYLKSDNEKTLKSISDTIGKYTVELSSVSTSVSESKTQGMNFSSSSSLTGRALLEPAELSRIKTPYSVCMLTGEYAAINELPDLSEYHLNKLYGLGDKKYNRTLIMEREAAREEHKIEPIPIWNIWNKYQSHNDERVSFL